MFGLLRLPPDCYFHISTYLRDFDAKVLSIVCKRVYNALIPFITKRDVAQRLKWINELHGTFNIYNWRTCGFIIDDQPGVPWAKTRVYFHYQQWFTPMRSFDLDGIAYAFSGTTLGLVVDGIFIDFKYGKIVSASCPLEDVKHLLRENVRKLILPPSHWMEMYNYIHQEQRDPQFWEKWLNHR